MIRTPIHRVLSTIRKHEVKSLLMGGQACIFYGAAECSRDTDLAIPRNYWAPLRAELEQLRHAIRRGQSGPGVDN